VTSINIQIWGAGGGGGMGTSTVGGAGAYITGLLAVTPGQVLSLIIGGPGTYATPTATPYGGGGAGSANGNVASGGGRSAIQFSPAGITLTAATSSGTAITYTASGAYGIANGSFVTVTGFTSTNFNISGAISVISGTQFSILSSLAVATATGTGLVYQELVDAAGGGGAGGVAGNQSVGGYGGILTGGAGVVVAGTAGTGGGATQTAGGTAGVGNGGTGYAGSLSTGAGYYTAGTAAGGGGFYGGGGGGQIAGGYGAAGGGGSSYISNSAFTYSATSAQSTGQAAPFTGTGYISGVAAGGNYASSGGGGLIVITNPPGGSMSEAMRIGTTGNVGIGTATPATLLDVAGTARTQTLSSLALNVCTINGVIPWQPIYLQSTVQGLGTAGYVSTAALNSSINALKLSVSTIYLSAAQIQVATGYISSLTVDSLALGSNAAFFTMGDVLATSISTFQVNTGVLYMNSTFIGNASSMTALQFYGNAGAYNQTALAEVSTGSGLQEFLIFRGSSASDRIRMQTTGSIVFEPGVGSRLWPNVASNVTPALILTIASNVGIQTATPAFPLDVAGTSRSRSMSTLSFNASTINGIPLGAQAVGVQTLAF